jgi:Response receiver domain
MPTASWPDIQDEIARSYCSSVLVLDDQIESAHIDGGVLLAPAFRKVREAFSAKGAICELRQIDTELDGGVVPSYLKQQMKKANVLVIDWHLGLDAKDPKHAVQVIKEVSAFSGFRFIGIFTNIKPEEVEAGLKHAFGENYQELKNGAGVIEEDGTTQDEDSPHPLDTATVTPIYQLGGHVYVAVVHKSMINAEAQLSNVFADCLKQIYPDHLRWAALEFAARARDEMPSVLAHLPGNTDVALAFQAMIQLPEEMAEGVAECLALELCESLRINHLKAVSDQTVLERVIDQIAQDESLYSPWKTINPATLKASCVQTDDRKMQPEFYQLFTKSYPNKGLRDNRDHISQRLAVSFGAAHQGCPVPDSHAAFAAFCEHLQSVKPDRLYPGVVLRKTKEGQEDYPEWLLCISPACDCVRGENIRNYLFVGGNSVPKFSGHGRGVAHTCLRNGEAFFHVCWRSIEFSVQRSFPTAKVGYEFFTRLHDAFVQQLVQTVWGHQTRGGVSTSEYVRVTRGND